MQVRKQVNKNNNSYHWINILTHCLVVRVLKSKDPAFPEGCHVVADCGWRTQTVTKANGPAGPILTRIVSEWPSDIPMSLALGSLGMPG